jgi:secreted trypsin-like serine protease
MRRAPRLFDLCLAALSCATFAACAIEGPRERAQQGRPDDSTALPIVGGSEATAYPEAVLINMMQGGSAVSYCSGSLIAPQVVLTAGHCVLQFDEYEVIAPYAGPPQSSTASQDATYDYAETGDSVNPSQHDVGVIFLDTPINIPSYLQVAAAPVTFGDVAHNIGRIDNGSLSQTSLFVSAPIGMQDGSAVGFPLDYYSNEVIQPGDSGGPVVLPGGAPRTVIAVNSGAGSGTQVLARVDLVKDWLEQQIAGGGGAGGAGGGGGGMDPDPPPPPPPPSGCEHDVCEPGAPLDPGCDLCAGVICSFDDYCCTTEWDEQCIDEAAFVCGC